MVLPRLVPGSGVHGGRPASGRDLTASGWKPDRAGMMKLADVNPRPRSGPPPLGKGQSCVSQTPPRPAPAQSASRQVLDRTEAHPPTKAVDFEPERRSPGGEPCHTRAPFRRWSLPPQVSSSSARWWSSVSGVRRPRCDTRRTPGQPQSSASARSAALGVAHEEGIDPKAGQLLLHPNGRRGGTLAVAPPLRRARRCSEKRPDFCCCPHRPRHGERGRNQPLFRQRAQQHWLHVAKHLERPVLGRPPLGFRGRLAAVCPGEQPSDRGEPGKAEQSTPCTVMSGA